MKFTVFVSGKPKKNLKKIPQPWQSRIIHALEQLEDDPYFGEKMWGEYAGSFKIRIWPYRVVYRIEKENRIIKVLEIGHRGNVSYD